MAFSAVLTGTARSCTLTSGSNSMVVSSASQLVVGATIQGTGIPTGSRIGTISGTTVTMVTATGAPSNATVGGAQNLIFSSVFGSLLTISLSASGDYATPQNIYNAGFGVMETNTALRELYFAGGLQVKWANIVSGAVFDFLNWTLEFGANGWWRFQESSIAGELRGGYLVNGTQFIKTAGPTFYSNNWNAGSAGGSSMFENISGTTNQGLFRMHNMRVAVLAGANASPSFSSARMTMTVENLIMDYQGDSAGANAGIGAAFGTVKNTYLVKTNGSLNATNGTNFATFDGLIYTGNYQSTPQHKFNLPQGYVLDNYSPQVLSTQFLGGFNSATLESYSNINLTTAGWGLDDLKTKYQRYSGPITLKFSRTVSFEFNDSTAANLTGVTLYIRSGSSSIINAVQTGDYSALTQALDLVWTANISSYRLCNSFVDTISQTAQVRKYGYQEQSVSYSLNLASYSQPFFILADSSLSGISETTAAAITTAGINWTAKTITPTADLTYDQINARIAWELAQTANSDYADPRTITGSRLVMATGWSLIVNTGIVIDNGTNIDYLYFPTVTLNGTAKITGLYENTSGKSSILTLANLTDTSVYVETNTAAQYSYYSNQDATLEEYFNPPKTGTWKWVATRLGYLYQTSTFTPADGGDFKPTINWLEDLSLIITDPVVLSAYTNLSDVNMMNDYFAYWITLNGGIPYAGKVFKDGTALNFGDADIFFSNTATTPLAYDLALNKFTIKATTINQGSTLFSVRTTGDVTVEAGTTLNIAYQDSSGLRASIFNLDPESFGITWYLRYKKQSGGAYTNVSGTGNSATVLMDVAIYDVQIRAAGYDWKTLEIDTAKTQILDAALAYQVSSINTPQYEMSYDVALANAFQYDPVSMKVSVTNTTGAIISPNFAELYQATQRIQHLPDLVWTWVLPITANSSTQKILIPPTNPIRFFLTNASNASVKLTAPVIYTDTGASADDRVLGNSSGYSIILGSPATAESAGLRSEIVSDIIAKIGGTNYLVDTHSLVQIADFSEKAYKNAKQAKINTF